MFRNPNLNNLGDLLRRNAVRYPDREGVVSETARLTWEEINTRSNRVAHGLINLGIKKGDRVAHMLTNCPQLVEILFGVLKIGGVMVPLNYRLSPDEISAIMNDSGAETILYKEDFSPVIQSIGQECPALRHVICVGEHRDNAIVYDQFLAESKDEEPNGNVKLDDLAYISYTGGTTGLPKGAMWLHQTLLDTVQDVQWNFDIAFKSRALFAVPPYAGGANVHLMNLIYCATTVILMDFDILKILSAIEKEKAELIALAAVPLFMMASHPEAHNYDMSSLKQVGYGGASMSLKQLEKTTPFFKCGFLQRYGGTETLLNVTCLQPHDHEIGDDPEKTARAVSGGRAGKGVEIRLLDKEGRDVPLGEVGEIAVKSRSIMAGYWNQPEKTTAAFYDGYYLTNDMAYMDEEGYLFIVDRGNDMIKTGGLNVYPAEVETVLLQHPGIAEAVVVSAPDEKWGERIVAVVVPKAGVSLTEQDVREFCRDRIGGYKIPKQVDFRDEPFPRDGLGKVRRKDFREKYWVGYGNKRVF